MFLNSVIIVLREVLEAAVILSVFLAMSRYLHLSLQWLLTGILSGLTGAALYHLNLGIISEAFDYSGQEVLNATIHTLLYMLLTIIICFVSFAITQSSRWLALFLTLTTCLAITLEGSEILAYMSAFTNNSASLFNAATGALIGAAIGSSVGALMYYFLTEWQSRHLLLWGQGLLALVAASMSVQIIQLLMQADILPAQNPFWDTSGLIAESSLAGQLLYAIAGYESTPTALQVFAYGFVLVDCFLLIILGRIKKP